jgi:hypothetical protein
VSKWCRVTVTRLPSVAVAQGSGPAVPPALARAHHDD